MKKFFWVALIVVILLIGIPYCSAELDNTYSPKSSSKSYSAYSSSSSDSKVVSRAKSYLRSSAFSKKSLIEQLEYEGFSESQATEAVNSLSVDWNEQAKLRAKSYMNYSSFSYKSLVEQLEYEGFTPSQAKYGADNCGYNISPSSSGSYSSGNNEQALKKAKSYLQSSSFSRKGLIEQLEYEGFSTAEAEYAVSHCGADWNEQAAKTAKSYKSWSNMSYSELKEQLIYEGFSVSQAEYGITHY